MHPLYPDLNADTPCAHRSSSNCRVWLSVWTRLVAYPATALFIYSFPVLFSSLVEDIGSELVDRICAQAYRRILVRQDYLRVQRPRNKGRAGEDPPDQETVFQDEQVHGAAYRRA